MDVIAVNSNMFVNGNCMMHDNDTMNGNGNCNAIMHDTDTMNYYDNGNATIHDHDSINDNCGNTIMPVYSSMNNFDNGVIHDDGSVDEHGIGNVNGTLHESIVIKTDNIDVSTSEVQPNKCRRKKSIVWEYFTTETVSADCTRACCKQCKKTFAYITGKKQAGTSHLKRHISLGICPANRVNQKENQLTPFTPCSQNGTITTPPRKRCRASPGSVTIALDQKRCIHEIARMIVLDEYPVNMVEHPGFVSFIHNLQPHFSMTSFECVQSEIVASYMRLKNSLANTLADIPGHVSLTMDLWTSDQTLGYALLTGHFIDSDWRLKRRVLKFVPLPFPESQVAFNHALMSCLSEWGLESKLLALTVDESFANKAIIDNLKGLLSIKNSQLLNGRFLLSNCYARVMTRMALEALRASQEAVAKVRDSVKHVKFSETCEDKFNELRQQLQLPHSQSLYIDSQRMWDSTYHMLSRACELKEVFLCLDTSDPDYKQAPTVDDWKCIEVLCAHLKLFFDASNILTSESYPTANTFFHEVCKIEMELAHGALNEDSVVSNFVRPLYEKFDKYWRNCCVNLAMAVAMDPRFKLKLVEFSFAKIFGEEAEIWLRIVDDSIHELYFEYVAQTLPLPSIHIEQSYEESIKPEAHLDDMTLPSSEGLSDFDIYISEFSSSGHSKSELDQYLDESLIPRGSEEFDVLDWWKLNRIKYPTLSKMAADILATPFSTLSGKSVFDTVSKKLDSHRSSLKPVTLEALVCANNWLQCGVQYSAPLLDNSLMCIKMETNSSL